MFLHHNELCSASGDILKQTLFVSWCFKFHCWFFGIFPSWIPYSLGILSSQNSYIHQLTMVLLPKWKQFLIKNTLLSHLLFVVIYYFHFYFYVLQILCISRQSFIEIDWWSIYLQKYCIIPDFWDEFCFIILHLEQLISFEKFLILSSKRETMNLDYSIVLLWKAFSQFMNLQR